MTNAVMSNGMPRPYVGAGVILTRLDGPTPRYLLLRGRETGVWSFSKGHPEVCDQGMHLRTAVRETYEETGFQAGLDYTLIGRSMRFGKRPYWIGILHAGMADRYTVARDEHDAAGWFTWSEIIDMNTNTDVRVWIKKARNEAGMFHYNLMCGSAGPMHSTSVACIGS
jgi:8-oxo-dGTP pyrophosphatase MutT (NUDIX family)